MKSDMENTEGTENMKPLLLMSINWCSKVKSLSRLIPTYLTVFICSLALPLIELRFRLREIKDHFLCFVRVDVKTIVHAPLCEVHD